jgi:cytoskeletal protein CcmA (bactofilin family)
VRPFLKSSGEPSESYIVAAKTSMDERDAIRRHIGLIAQSLQLGDDALPLVALNLDPPVLDCPTRPAPLFEQGGKFSHAVVIEGQVEATVHSKTMQIDKPGTLSGTAVIDVAEIHGEFSGELTARTRLVVHGTGRVSGTIRYGKLIVAEGGELTGDIKQLEGSEGDAQAPLLKPDWRQQSGTSTASGSTTSS